MKGRGDRRTNGQGQAYNAARGVTKRTAGMGIQSPNQARKTFLEQQ